MCTNFWIYFKETIKEEFSANHRAQNELPGIRGETKCALRFLSIGNQKAQPYKQSVTIFILGSEGEGRKYFMTLRFTNNIGQDALIFSSDNSLPNGMLVKKGSRLTVMKTLVSRVPVNFVAIDKSTSARLYLNNVGKLKIMSSHSQDDINDVILMISGKWLLYIAVFKPQ